MPPSVRKEKKAPSLLNVIIFTSRKKKKKRAKIFSRESRSYLSNSPQTNLAILHDEYSYIKWGVTEGDGVAAMAVSVHTGGF